MRGSSGHLRNTTVLLLLSLLSLSRLSLLFTLKLRQLLLLSMSAFYSLFCNLLIYYATHTCRREVCGELNVETTQVRKRKRVGERADPTFPGDFPFKEILGRGQLMV